MEGGTFGSLRVGFNVFVATRWILVRLSVSFDNLEKSMKDEERMSTSSSDSRPTVWFFGDLEKSSRGVTGGTCR